MITIRNTKELETVRDAILAKTQEMEHMEHVIRNMRKDYSNMTDEELNAAVSDIMRMRVTVEGNKRYLQEAAKAIAVFLTPEVLVA